MLNVGANKGYDVRNFIERFDASWRVTGRRWARLLANHNVTGQPCGACDACGETPLWRAPRNVRVGTVLAVEEEARNAAVLSKLAKAHVLRGHDVRVLHAVVTGPGASATSEAARTTTVDQLLASHSMHAVDLCLIDAAGHDHAVLRGAEGALRAHSLRVVVFQYSGLWCFRQPGNACVRLEPEVAFLERFGYACWWLGNSGDVSRVDPTCEDVSTRHWANVGCVADPGLVAKMRELERFGAKTGLGGA